MFPFIILIVAAAAQNDFSAHKNFKFLPTNCGETNVKELIDGKAHLFEFQWTALLYYEEKKNSFRCTGSVINDRYVLTAASCLKSPIKLIGVRVGEFNLTQNPDCEGAVCAQPHQDLQIEEAIAHPSYNTKTLLDDIGLIRLSSKIENVKPVCLPLSQKDINYDFSNKNVLVSGWKFQGKNYSAIELERTVRPYYALEECRKVLKSYSITNQMCAGGKENKDTCFGLSGAALYGTEDRNRLVQQGFLVFGPHKCEIKTVPAVFTKISSYMQWILDTIRE